MIQVGFNFSLGLNKMDVAYSTLAFADAIHNFGSLAITHKNTIQYGLPGFVLNIDNLLLKNNFDGIVRDIFFGRSNDIHILDISSAKELHKELCDGYPIFGLLSDANGSTGLLDILEKYDKAYYIVKNRENLCDPAISSEYTYLKTGIIVSDKDEAQILYPKWLFDMRINSKFCSKYDFILDYVSETTIIFVSNGIRNTINLNHQINNPNNCTNVEHTINTTASIEIKSIAFQRKRSGDWLQALSTLDNHRLYTFPDNTVEKLRGPVYFCTADRIAAAYAISIGVNTIFVQPISGIHLIYKNRISLEMDAFYRTPFEPEKTMDYKNTIATAIDTYKMRKLMIIDALTFVPSSSNDLMRYISYLYSYVILMDMIGKMLESKMELIQRFMNSINYDEFTNSENCKIYDIYNITLTEIPKLMSYDIHDMAAFPSLPTINPISSSGIVDTSDIYIAGLLYEFNYTREVQPYVAKCIEYILHLSTPSETLRSHYNSILSAHAHTGGFDKQRYIKYNVSDMHNLCKIYIQYLYNVYNQGKRYNEITQGKYSLNGCGDISVCYSNLKYIVQTLGIMKNEFRDLEFYKHQKEKEVTEREQPKSDPEFDSWLNDVIKQGKKSLLEKKR